MTVITARIGRNRESVLSTFEGAAMAERVTVFWQGKEYDAVRSEGRDAIQHGQIWQVRRDGAPVTTFVANPGEGAGAVKGKIIEWLEGNESRPALDVGRQ